MKHLFFLIFLLTAIRSSAQLCDGSLGDPIVNITFGAGANPGPPLSAATTNYPYFTSDCPYDGQYTIRNNSVNCFGNTWHNLSGDHTGDGNGYFMLVNASEQPSTFFIDTLRGLCANTTYEFAAWIVNLTRPTSCDGTANQPNLTFAIEKTDGTLLKSFNSGNIPPAASALWRQYGNFFTTSVGVTDVVLKIVNNAPGGCGNDLALDDITFRPCGPSLIPSFVGHPGTVLKLCEASNTNVTLTSDVSTGFTNPYFQWQKSINNGASWSDITGANEAQYTTSIAVAKVSITLYRLSVAEIVNSNIAACRVNSSNLAIIIDPKPVSTLSNNTPVCVGSPLLLTINGGSAYRWTGPNGFSSPGSTVSKLQTQENDAGRYYIEVTGENGCKETVSTMVNLNPKPTVALLFSDTTICEGFSVKLCASGGASYNWSPSATLSSSFDSSPVAFPSATTRYRIVASNGLCFDTSFVEVNVVRKPKANAGPDKAIMEGESVQLEGSGAGDNISIRWVPASFISNPNVLNPVVSPSADTSYTLTVSPASGCGIATDIVRVKVYKQIVVPNAFSPNGDGINDTWNIPALEAYKNHEVSVFNRYGQRLMFSNDFRHWNGEYNGKQVPIGTYYYVIKVKETRLTLSGYLVLLR
ncbi:MAG: hypothetical protein JWQ96_2903 [Segetibacter sp.]|nr:hypothetical protein [Segetibacter sp.]